MVQAVGIMSFLLERVNTDTIRLVGGWSRDVMLLYLHMYGHTFKAGMAIRMV